jgi:hypothetical protein
MTFDHLPPPSLWREHEEAHWVLHAELAQLRKPRRPRKLTLAAVARQAAKDDMQHDIDPVAAKVRRSADRLRARLAQLAAANPLDAARLARVEAILSDARQKQVPCDLWTEWIRAGTDWLRKPGHHLALETDGEVRCVADKLDSVEDAEPVEPVKRTRKRKPSPTSEMRKMKRAGFDIAGCEFKRDGTFKVITGKPTDAGDIDMDDTTLDRSEWN